MFCKEPILATGDVSLEFEVPVDDEDEFCPLILLMLFVVVLEDVVMVALVEDVAFEAEVLILTELLVVTVVLGRVAELAEGVLLLVVVLLLLLLLLLLLDFILDTTDTDEDGFSVLLQELMTCDCCFLTGA